MKQLKKMALKEAVVLTDNEKKMVRGGDKKEKSCDKTCTGSCTVYIFIICMSMELAIGIFQQVRLYVDAKYMGDEKTNLSIKSLFVFLFFP